MFDLLTLNCVVDLVTIYGSNLENHMDDLGGEPWAGFTAMQGRPLDPGARGVGGDVLGCVEEDGTVRWMHQRGLLPQPEARKG
jgi:hypothetical protein